MDAPTPAEALAARLSQRFGEKLNCRTAVGQVTAELAAEDLVEVCRALRDEPDLRFEQLMDVCGVDYSAYGQADWLTEDASTSGFSRGVSPRSYREAPPEGGPDGSGPGRSPPARSRFAVVYHLLSVTHNRRVRLRAYAEGDPPCIASLIDLWPSADWFEREAFDLFGILFEGHPDLRRILTDYGFIGHPFRKDFPLEGNVEVRYDPEQERVIYQPVTIENRVLVPKVIRHDYPVPSTTTGTKADA
ncbi:MAG: NADH-quinone oxidoreductase subunit C [Gammaproteobacteria bacterium]